MTTNSVCMRTKISESFDMALRQGGVVPMAVRFEGSRVAFALKSAQDVTTARALLTAAGCLDQDMDDFDLTETGRGHLLLARVA